MSLMKMMPMISCREASRLMSEKMDRHLGLPERLSLRLHLVMCKGCTLIARQITGLRNLFRAYRKRAFRKPPLSWLSTEQKEQIKQKLKE
jgi:hypothetical protein